MSIDSDVLMGLSDENIYQNQPFVERFYCHSRQKHIHTSTMNVFAVSV